MSDRFTFVAPPQGAPRTLVANVEVQLDGTYTGLKIRGVQIWRQRQPKPSTDGLFVEFPKATYEKPSQSAPGTTERRTYYYVAEQDPEINVGYLLKQQILAAYRATRPNTHDKLRRYAASRPVKRNN